MRNNLGSAYGEGLRDAFRMAAAKRENNLRPALAIVAFVVVGLALLVFVVPILITLLVAAMVAVTVYGALEVGARGAMRLSPGAKSFRRSPLPRRDAIATGRGRSGTEQLMLDVLLTEYERAHGEPPPPDLSEADAAELRIMYLERAVRRRPVAALLEQMLGAPLHKKLVAGDPELTPWMSTLLERPKAPRRPFWLSMRLMKTITRKFGWSEEQSYETVEDLVRNEKKFYRAFWKAVRSPHILAIEEALANELPAPVHPVLPAPSHAAPPATVPKSVEPTVEEEPAPDDPASAAVQLVELVEAELGDTGADGIWGKQELERLQSRRRALADAEHHHPSTERVCALLDVVDTVIERWARFDSSFERVMGCPEGTWPRWATEAIEDALKSDEYTGAPIEAAWPIVERHARRLFCLMPDEPEMPKEQASAVVPDVSGSGDDIVEDEEVAVASPAPIQRYRDVGTELGL